MGRWKDTYSYKLSVPSDKHPSVKHSLSSSSWLKQYLGGMNKITSPLKYHVYTVFIKSLTSRGICLWNILDQDRVIRIQDCIAK